MTHPSENIFATTQTPHSAIQRCLIISSVSTDHPALCHKPLYAESLLTACFRLGQECAGSPPPPVNLSVYTLWNLLVKRKALCVTEAEYSSLWPRILLVRSLILSPSSWT